jgi:hypothetical protein
VFRDGNCFGNSTLKLAIFASTPGPAAPTPGDGNDSLVNNDAPCAFVACPAVEAVNTGLNGNPAHPVAANGADTPALPPAAPVTVPVTANASQFVGLNVNGRSPPITTSTLCTLKGTPSTICGNAPDTTDTTAVTGFTRIDARTTTFPK